MDLSWLNQRPLMVAIAGPNGAGKTTFYESHIAPGGLMLINADRLAGELEIDPYAAARLASALRENLVQQGNSFAFETVFSDPVGDKLEFLKRVSHQGYTVILCFIGLETAELSMERVAIRVSRGGHDVPNEKIASRFPRTLSNLKSSIKRLPHVLVFDNSSYVEPYRLLAVFEHGKAIELSEPLPRWLAD